MKYFEVVRVQNDGYEEWLIWKGFDYNEALLQKEDALSDFDKYLTKIEKKRNHLEFRMYEISDDTDIYDEDEMSNAVCECCGYYDF